MSNEADIAFKRLEKLAEPDYLSNVFEKFNLNATTKADITSCNATNIAVLKTITNQVITAGDDASAMTGIKPLVKSGMNQKLTEQVRKALETPVVIYFGLQFMGAKGGDHHFSAFSLDAKTVVASMAWQDIYDFTQWFTKNEGGRFEKDLFLRLIGRIEDGFVEGVAALCSFLGMSKSGMSIPVAVSNDIAGSRPTIKSSACPTLPKT
jgi:hypothetical protein